MKLPFKIPSLEEWIEILKETFGVFVEDLQRIVDWVNQKL